QTFVIVCRFDSDSRHSNKTCVGRALASPSGRNPPAFGLCRFDSCPAHSNAPWPAGLSVEVSSPSSSNGGFDSRAGHSKFSTKWRNWKTHDAQNVGPIEGMGVRVAPLSLLTQVAQCPAKPH